MRELINVKQDEDVYRVFKELQRMRVLELKMKGVYWDIIREEELDSKLVYSKSEISKSYLVKHQLIVESLSEQTRSLLIQEQVDLSNVYLLIQVDDCLRQLDS